MDLGSIVAKTYASLLFDLAKGVLLSAITLPFLIPAIPLRNAAILFITGTLCVIVSIKARLKYYQNIQKGEKYAV